MTHSTFNLGALHVRLGARVFRSDGKDMTHAQKNQFEAMLGDMCSKLGLVSSGQSFLVNPQDNAQGEGVPDELETIAKLHEHNLRLVEACRDLEQAFKKGKKKGRIVKSTVDTLVQLVYSKEDADAEGNHG